MPGGCGEGRGSQERLCYSLCLGTGGKCSQMEGEGSGWVLLLHPLTRMHVQCLQSGRFHLN